MPKRRSAKATLDEGLRMPPVPEWEDVRKDIRSCDHSQSALISLGGKGWAGTYALPEREEDDQLDTADF